jgi:hypothetical protein
MSEIERLRRENEILLKTMEYYGDLRNWKPINSFSYVCNVLEGGLNGFSKAVNTIEEIDLLK